MSWLACEVCGFLINTDHDPECFQEWTNGEECIVCQRCRGEDEELRWQTETGNEFLPRL